MRGDAATIEEAKECLVTALRSWAAWAGCGAMGPISRVRTSEHQPRLDRIKRRFDLHPRRLAGDSAYGAVKLLKALVDRNITPHVPVWDKSARADGTFSRADFVFEPERNVYICPGGAELTSTGTVDQGTSSITGPAGAIVRPAP